MPRSKLRLPAHVAARQKWQGSDRVLSTANALLMLRSTRCTTQPGDANSTTTWSSRLGSHDDEPDREEGTRSRSVGAPAGPKRRRRIDREGVEQAAKCVGAPIGRCPVSKGCTRIAPMAERVIACRRRRGPFASDRAVALIERREIISSAISMNRDQHGPRGSEYTLLRRTPGRWLPRWCGAPIASQ
jgi:hypothetical protein